MTRYLIIGNGVAGMAGALGIRELDPAGEITIVHDEPHAPYFRAAMSEWMHGRISDEELDVRPAALAERLGLRSVQATASRLHLDTQQVQLEDGGSLPFDKLLVATGARPFVPPWPGVELQGFHVYRTLGDCAQIKAACLARPELPAVIIGGGILGLEFAYDAKGLGVDAVMLVRECEVGVPIFSEGAAARILARLRDDGVQVLRETETERVEGRGGRVEALLTEDGRRIPCSAVVAAVGVRADLSLFEGTGIAMGQQVSCDEHLRTSHPAVYAAGDVCQVLDPSTGEHVPTRTWEPCYWQGRVAGANMAGGDERYLPGATMNASLVYDLHYALLGDFQAAGPDVEELLAPNSRGPYAYRRILLRQGVPVGGTFIQDRRQYLVWLELMRRQVDISAHRERLFDDHFDLNLLLPPGGLDYRFF